MGIEMRNVCAYCWDWFIKLVSLWVVSRRISGIWVVSVGVNLPRTKFGLSGWFLRKSVPVPRRILGKSEVPRRSMMDLRPLFPP